MSSNPVLCMGHGGHLRLIFISWISTRNFFTRLNNNAANNVVPFTEKGDAGYGQGGNNDSWISIRVSFIGLLLSLCQRAVLIIEQYTKLTYVSPKPELEPLTSTLFLEFGLSFRRQRVIVIVRASCLLNLLTLLHAPDYSQTLAEFFFRLRKSPANDRHPSFLVSLLCSASNIQRSLIT